ncbi:hypothetical protein MCUN1_000098 [Malassezia cuniculi]|uniref:Uncharacterized protein n=1 Tax=Malassezia cuniculi TaxID=948313 RepID=A0AAF0J4Q1_9BASI|nr:hypothetical protein MCUN1_000098 [Malassezia cuniculi]
MYYRNFLALALVAATGLASANVDLGKRQASHSEQKAIHNQGTTDPVAAAKAVLAIKNIGEQGSLWANDSLVSGDENGKQVPWASNVTFHSLPAAQVDGESWATVPDSFDSFTLNKTTKITDRKGVQLTMPFYINSKYTASNIKRAIIVWPGMWRDSWRYAAMTNNAYEIAKSMYGVEDGSVLIIAPLFLNEGDKQSGSVADDYVFFKDAGWSVGGTTHNENGTITSFAIIDKLIDYVTNTREFPNLEKVVMVGHSLGAQANQRYAVLSDRGNKPISYWFGNPGAYTWLSNKRPDSTSGCDNFDSWPNGIGNADSVSVYGRRRLKKNKDGLVQDFLNRETMIALGLTDNGGHSSSCEKNVQGANRLQKGANFILHLNDVNGGFPEQFKVNFVPRVSHQDYPMLANLDTVQYIFT